MKVENIILVGGGGHCISAIEVIESVGKYNILGILDIEEKVGEKILGYNIIGTDDQIPQLMKKCSNFLITVGQIKSNFVRIKLFNLIKKCKGNLPTIISSSANVSKYAVLGEGTLVCHDVFINAGVKIGHNCIINTKALIEHEVKIGDNCHASTAVVLNGQVKIGDNCFIGSSVVVANNINICSNTTIGVGSLIVKNINQSGVYFGNPLLKKD